MGLPSKLIPYTLSSNKFLQLLQYLKGRALHGQWLQQQIHVIHWVKKNKKVLYRRGGHVVLEEVRCA